MEELMVVVVLVLDIALVGVAVVALFRGMKGEQGQFSAFGVSVSGTGGSLFLVVGAVLLFAAKNWNDGLARKAELAHAVGQYQRSVATLTERSNLLESRVPTSELATIKSQHAQLFKPTEILVPKSALIEVRRFQPKTKE